MLAERAVEIFALLANETRLAIVSQLAQSDVPALGVCQLSQRVGVARSTAKRQAERLEEAGLLVQDVSAETVRWSLDENVFADFLSFQSRRLNFDANPESASQQGKFKVSVQLLRSPPRARHTSLAARLQELDGAHDDATSCQPRRKTSGTALRDRLAQLQSTDLEGSSLFTGSPAPTQPSERAPESLSHDTAMRP